MYNPIHYPIGDIFSPYKEILSCNNGHRNIPAWAVPESEVPLICSEKEWEEIQRREFEKFTLRVLMFVVLKKKVGFWLLAIVIVGIIRVMSVRFARALGLSAVYLLWCPVAARFEFCRVRP